jgi:hypothetical protein
MRRQITKETIKVSDTSKHIRVLIDPKTVVTVKDMSAFEFWLAKYPGARIIN